MKKLSMSRPTLGTFGRIKVCQISMKKKTLHTFSVVEVEELNRY